MERHMDSGQGIWGVTSVIVPKGIERLSRLVRQQRKRLCLALGISLAIVILIDVAAGRVYNQMLAETDYLHNHWTGWKFYASPCLLQQGNCRIYHGIVHFHTDLQENPSRRFMFETYSILWFKASRFIELR